MQPPTQLITLHPSPTGACPAPCTANISQHPRSQVPHRVPTYQPTRPDGVESKSFGLERGTYTLLG
eukprot:2544147-Rhodomonas_salina.3